MKSNPQLWWFVARAAGVVGWALCTASVLWGLALSTRILGKKPPAPWLLDLHRFLGGLAVVFVCIHIAGLVADSYAHFGPSEILVPLASKWKAVPVAWGVVGLYLLAAIELTSLCKKRIPKRIWQRVHLTSFLLYMVATAHLLTAGTDAQGALTYAAVVSVALVVFLTTYRVVVDRRSKRPLREVGGSRTAGPRALDPGTQVIDPPTKCPTPYVTAIAAAPPMTTRRAPRANLAPPAAAPPAPRARRATSDAIAMIQDRS